MSIGSTKIAQICFATWDLSRAEKCWTRILGIEPQKRKTPAWNEVPSYTHSRPDTFHEVEFLIYTLEDGTVLEVFGPGEGETPWRSFLEKHGEGVMHVGFYVPDRASAYKEIGAVCEAQKPYHEGFYPGGTYTFVDTTPELGVELNIKRDEDNTALIAALLADPAGYGG